MKDLAARAIIATLAITWTICAGIAWRRHGLGSRS